MSHVFHQFGDNIFLSEDTSGIIKYIENVIDAPSGLFQLTDLPLESLHLPFDWGNIKAYAQKKLLPQKIEWAAWKWFQPPSDKEDDWQRKLLNIRKSAQLEHLQLWEFRDGIARQKDLWLKRHPVLKNWLRRRIAQLDWLCDGMDYSHLGEFVKMAGRATTSLQRDSMTLLALAIRFLDDLDGFKLECDRLASTALEMAGHCLGFLFANEEFKTCANLMVPFQNNSDNVPFYLPPNSIHGMTDTALRLWKHFNPASESLVVVAESEDAKDLGFWVPLCVSDEANYLPGAPEAFAQNRSNTVYRDDPPLLTSRGFTKHQQNCWYGFLENSFKERLFISIPLQIKLDGGRTSTIAVFNVNAIPSTENQNGWSRAYHKEWLDIAQSCLAPMIHIAFEAIEIRRHFEENEADIIPLAVKSEKYKRLKEASMFANILQPFFENDQEEGTIVVRERL